MVLTFFHSPFLIFFKQPSELHCLFDCQSAPGLPEDKEVVNKAGLASLPTPAT